MRARMILAAAIAVGVMAAGLGTTPASANKGPSDPLDVTLMRAMRTAGFDEVVDFGPEGDACPDPSNAACIVPAPRISHMPNVDVAVITLDADGHVADSSNVIISRDYPRGRHAVINPVTLSARNIQFRAWDIDRWNGDTSWDAAPLTAPLNAPASTAPLDFMSPYPASLFKIIVAWHVMRLVDAGTLTLDTVVTDADDVTKSVREWMDEMITFSDNAATRALLFHLHQIGQIDAMNADVADLGLTTLQVNGTDPATGGNWQPGLIHMSALDTAKLFLLIQGGSGQLWRAPDGRSITRAELSEPSRTFLKGLLLDQGFNEVLSSSNFCGASFVKPGIPQLVPQRWIDPGDGTVTVDGIPYGVDVRPCNETAEVTFAHKTGLTWNYGSDGGIVESLPGQPRRTYVIVMLSNLGYRYGDPRYADATISPCFVPGVCYSQRIPKLAGKIDAFLKSAAS